MELFVERKWKKPTYTIGNLYVDGIYLCNTLEDKDRGLTQDMPTTEIYKKKCYGATAMPTGRYLVRLSYCPKFATREWSKKYGGLVPEILDMPTFSNPRIHPGADCNSTANGILVGRNAIRGKLTDSVKCYYELMDNYLMHAHKAGEGIWIMII